MNNYATTIPDSSQYAADVALANAVLKANANITQTAALYKPEYSQVYFPYDGKTSNTLRVGHPTSIGPSGVTLPGKHTYETCKLNATKAAADKSQFVFNMDTTTSNPSATVAPGDFTTNASVFENANAVSYKSVEEADAFIAGLTTDAVYSVEIRLMLNSPKKGAAKCLPEMASMPQNATIAVWTHALTAKPVLEQANLYVKNGVKQNTINDDRDFIIIKNTPFPITIRFIANQQANIVDFIKVQIKSKATNEILEIETLNMPAKGMPTPTFFNFNTATQACTIVNGPDFVYESERVVFKQPLQADISFVGLTTKGYLYQFVNNQDLGLNPQPINTIVYDPKNPAVIDSSYKLSINEKLSAIVVKNTNTKTEKIIVNLTPVDISLNKNTDWLANNPMTKINCGRISGSDIPQMQITKTQPLVSKNGYYKMFISPTNELVVVASIQSANNAFAVMPDYRSGKLFLADTNEKSQTMIHVPAAYQKPTTSFTKYPDMYPLQELQKNYKTVLNANCEAECNKIGCDHYYESKTQNGNVCAISNNSNYVFAPQQNNSLLASTLYVTNKRITTKDYKKDAEQLDAYPYMSNGLNDKILDYNLANFEYSETTDLTSFIGGQAMVSNTVGLAFGNNSQDKVTGQSMSVYMTDSKEGFVDATWDVNLPAKTVARIDNQIIPLQNVYLNNQGRVMQNRVDISNTITDINTNYNYQASNNELYDFSGNNIIYSLKPDRSITPAILKDQQTMLEEHNNLYIVSTITVATLLIAAIFVASD